MEVYLSNKPKQVVLTFFLFLSINSTFHLLPTFFEHFYFSFILFTRPKRSREIFASYSGFHNRMENMLVGIENTAMKDVAGYDEQLGYMESKEDQGRDVEVVEEGAPGSLFR